MTASNQTQQTPAMNTNSGLSVGRSSSEDLPPALPLSPTMQAALDYAKAHGGALVRQPGGFWVGADESNRLLKWFGTSTVQALVVRGVLFYDEWQESRNGKFPIRASIPKEPT